MKFKPPLLSRYRHFIYILEVLSHMIRMRAERVTLCFIQTFRICALVVGRRAGEGMVRHKGQGLWKLRITARNGENLWVTVEQPKGLTRLLLPIKEDNGQADYQSGGPFVGPDGFLHYRSDKRNLESKCK